MSARNTADGWGWVAKALHWLIFFLMVAAWFAVESHEDFPKGSAERAQWMLLHKSFGVSVFFLVWLRLYWRFSGPVPKPEPGPRWQLQMASLMHWALYALMILMPLSALMAAQFSDRPAPFFGLFEIPVVFAANKPAAGLLMELHKEILWPLLLVQVAGHAGAAFWHHFFIKDRTLRRILPFFS